ncbi:MAG TPA: hypothetical protein VHN99_10205, partial [Deinococcales bacterium]|nr:hypothetical protein [Deinococcales bacterium]
AEAFARAGFVNLLSAGGLDGMAAATTVLDRQVRAWLAGRGVPLNVLDDLGQLRGFLEAPGTG